ncbi:MAG: DnaJ domain-containing protein [Polyangiaceae bacterium]|nr:DnaJ domain-containing protein [Polyangiaceae bacterium]
MSSAESQLHAWADVLDDSDYYELLGVLHIADDNAIRQGFHVFAAAFHPDAHRYSDGADQRLATQIYHRGTEAYRVLLDPKLRSRYDLELAKGNLRLSALGVSCRPGGSRPDNGPKPPAPGPDEIASLEDLCETPAARLLARQSEDFIAAGELRKARDALREALTREGQDNEALEDRLDDLEMALYAQGD